MKALWTVKDDNGYRTTVTDIPADKLPEGNVHIAVEYSTLNYKDSLAITGKSPVVRNFPMVPGIDLAGKVLRSQHPDFHIGDRVVLNGYGIGENVWGGLAQEARVEGDWLVKLPATISTKQAMAIGTAGYTAMLAVLALEAHGITPQQGPVLVTGASGGVGSVAVSLLAKLGYTVEASTGKAAEHDYLKKLGAHAVIDRNEFSSAGKPLEKERWAAAIDTVGSHTLANVCASIKRGGAVSACGLAQGADLPLTVMPFLLRGVALLGIDSVYCPHPKRITAWQRLATDLAPEHLTLMQQEVALADAIKLAPDQLAGRIKGRIVVDVNR